MRVSVAKYLFRLSLGLGVSLSLGLSASGLARAQETPVHAPPKIPATSYYLAEFHSGFVIAEENADNQVEPASITKLMTAYIIFTELAGGNITLDDPVTISEKAWRAPGSRTFVEVDTEVSVRDLLMGMIVQSGNDASVALAEHIAGSEQAFAELMNHYAAQLGMTNSHFENSTGLPADAHLSSARDVARLAVALIREFPEYYRWYSVKEFTYNDITQHNRNSLLWRDDTVDGIKTGHTDSAGYCLVSSAERGSMRLIAVVMGTPSEKARADSSRSLLNHGFRNYETHRLYAPGEAITAHAVWKGAAPEADIGIREELFVTIPRGRYDALSAEMDVRARLVAPIAADENVGTLRVHLGDTELASAPLHALHAVAAGSLWRRAVDQVRLWVE